MPWVAWLAQTEADWRSIVELIRAKLREVQLTRPHAGANLPGPQKIWLMSAFVGATAQCFSVLRDRDASYTIFCDDNWLVLPIKKTIRPVYHCVAMLDGIGAWTENYRKLVRTISARIY